jgi:hypothetical protein
MDLDRVYKNASIILDTLNRNTPITNEQFDYYLKINELKFLDGEANLCYKNKQNIPLPASGEWEILAKVKNNINPENLTKNLLENKLIENISEIKDSYYNTGRGFAKGLNFKIKKDNLKLEVYFFHNGEK